MRKQTMLCLLGIAVSVAHLQPAHAWGFYGHRKINYMACFLLPPEMMALYKSNIAFLTDHAVDPDMRRYAIPEEAPRHYIDLDKYGKFPYDTLPRRWDSAVARFGEDTLNAHGIVPWWTQTMLRRLTAAFKAKDQSRILKLSAEIGHYIADAHVPLHACSNHNGQYSNQKGIHGFWESRVPELSAENEYDFVLEKAALVDDPGKYMWARVMESAAASDTVLKTEAVLNSRFPPDQKFAYENRNGKLIRQYSTAYTKAYERQLNGMVERRMRMAIYAVASFWYTAWVNAGQPDLKTLINPAFSEAHIKSFDELTEKWKNGNAIGAGCGE